MTGDALCRRSGAFQSPSLMGDIRQWLTGLPFRFTDGGFVDNTNFLEMVIDLLDFSQVFSGPSICQWIRVVFVQYL